MYGISLCNQRLRHPDAIFGRMLSIRIGGDNADGIKSPIQHKGQPGLEGGAFSTVHIMLKNGAERPFPKPVEYSAARSARAVIHHDNSLKSARGKLIHISDKTLFRLICRYQDGDVHFDFHFPLSARIFYQRNRMNRYSAALADRVHAFIRLPLHGNRSYRSAKHLRKASPDQIRMRSELRSLAYDSDINIAYAIPGACDLPHHRLQKHGRIGILPARISIREVRPYVAECRRSKERVYHGVDQHIRIGMPFKSGASGNLDAAKPLLRGTDIRTGAAIQETVRIISESDSHASYQKPP